MSHPFGAAATFAWREGGDRGPVFSRAEHPRLPAAGTDVRVHVTVAGPPSTCHFGASDEVVVPWPAIPEGFSPNGDGVNDLFRVPCLPGFDGGRLEVLNRWGTRVFAADDYRAEWGGRSDAAADLPDGTYFYVVSPAAGGEPVSGWVHLRR